MLRIIAFFAIWMGCWFGGWIVGGLMFPNDDAPSVIGAFFGFWLGLFGGAYVTHLDRISSR